MTPRQNRKEDYTERFARLEERQSHLATREYVSETVRSIESRINSVSANVEVIKATMASKLWVYGGTVTAVITLIGVLATLITVWARLSANP